MSHHFLKKFVTIYFVKQLFPFFFFITVWVEVVSFIPLYNLFIALKTQLKIIEKEK